MLAKGLWGCSFPEEREKNYYRVLLQLISENALSSRRCGPVHCKQHDLVDLSFVISPDFQTTVFEDVEARLVVRLMIHHYDFPDPGVDDFTKA